MSLYKNERYEKLAVLSMTNASNNLQNEIKMMASSPLILPEVADVLENYYQINPLEKVIKF